MEHIENDDQFAGLTVNSGVEQPPVVNPYMKKRRRQPLPYPQRWSKEYSKAMSQFSAVQ